jgi:glycosyltransferase involved in cell wall biosynthesis
MRIAVNTRLLIPGKLEGLGRFTYESLKRITQLHPEHQFIFIFDRKYPDEFIFSNNITPVVGYPQARHPLLWYLYFEWGIPPILKKQKADLFLSPDGWLSLSSKVPSISVIHDLNFFHNPEWVDKLPGYYYNYFFPKYIHKAARIATVSEYSKRDIVSRFNIRESLIDVVYNGASEYFHPIDEAAKNKVRQKYTDGKPYFLFLGLVHPRKNLTNIIYAYNAFRKSTSADVKLMIVGSTKYWTDDTRLAYENSPYRESLIFAGRLIEEDLNAVVASSLALVYASLFEGFGIPIIEAMRCKVPVITSNITSMPEVGGDAVCYVNPYSVQSICEGLTRMWKDELYRSDLIIKGNQQYKKFSWDNTANRLWQSIETVLGKTGKMGH